MIGVPLRILLVEDDPADVLLLRESMAELRWRDYELLWAESMKSMERVVAKEAPDIVLLDLTLPDSSGIETLQQFAGRHPDIPVIVLTGLDDERVALEAVRQGAQDYLVKSRIDPEVLARSIRYSIERTRIRVELDRTNAELRRANARLEELAIRDPLTGLLNRRGLERVLSREVERTRRSGASLHALVVDLDDFKRINDSLGHAAGDFVLRAVAIRMELAIRATDRVARLGGDEFLILLPDTSPPEGALVGEKVRAAIANEAMTIAPHGEISVTASLGCVTVAPESASIGGLLRLAQNALHASKLGGKNRVHVAPAAGSTHTLSEIVGALLSGAPALTFAQPIRRVADGRDVAFELSLSVHLDGVEIPCVDVQHVGAPQLVAGLDRECLRRAMAVLPQLPADTGVHLNISPLTLLERGAADIVLELSRHAEPRRFVIELGEAQLLADPRAFLAPVRELMKAGIRIALDHVSILHASLAGLAILEPSLVKVNLRRTGDGPMANDETALTRLVTAVAALGGDVVAEGIERDDDLALIRRVGIPFAQGACIAPPRLLGASA